jgi:hypothetical protein
MMSRLHELSSTSNVQPLPLPALLSQSATPSSHHPLHLRPKRLRLAPERLQHRAITGIMSAHQ